MFGTSLRALVDSPRLYGWDWDVTVLDEAGYGDIDPAQAGALLDDDPAVAAWSGVYFQSVELEGTEVPALGLALGAPVSPPILAGGTVLAPNEVVLGTTTLDALGKRIGDTVALGTGGDQPLPLRIVGTAVFPTVGPVFGTYTSLGKGAMLLYDQIPGWDQISPGPKALFVRFRPGADAEAAQAGLRRESPSSATWPAPPSSWPCSGRRRSSTTSRWGPRRPCSGASSCWPRSCRSA